MNIHAYIHTYKYIHIYIYTYIYIHTQEIKQKKKNLLINK